MHMLFLAFNARTTLRLEEISGALAFVAGGALLIGFFEPHSRVLGQFLGGLALAIAGVLFVGAVRYGVRP